MAQKRSADKEDTIDQASNARICVILGDKTALTQVKLNTSRTPTGQGPAEAPTSLQAIRSFLDQNPCHNADFLELCAFNCDDDDVPAPLKNIAAAADPHIISPRTHHIDASMEAAIKARSHQVESLVPPPPPRSNTSVLPHGLVLIAAMLHGRLHSTTPMCFIHQETILPHLVDPKLKNQLMDLLGANFDLIIDGHGCEPYRTLDAQLGHYYLDFLAVLSAKHGIRTIPTRASAYLFFDKQRRDALIRDFKLPQAIVNPVRCSWTNNTWEQIAQKLQLAITGSNPHHPALQQPSTDFFLKPRYNCAGLFCLSLKMHASTTTGATTYNATDFLTGKRYTSPKRWLQAIRADKYTAFSAEHYNTSIQDRELRIFYSFTAGKLLKLYGLSTSINAKGEMVVNELIGHYGDPSKPSQSYPHFKDDQDLLQDCKDFAVGFRGYPIGNIKNALAAGCKNTPTALVHGQIYRFDFVKSDSSWTLNEVDLFPCYSFITDASDDWWAAWKISESLHHMITKNWKQWPS